MIPTLFPSTATEFKTQGLGALTDAISCTVEEERNGAYELEMEYPVSGVHYNEIKTRCIIFAIPSPYRLPQPFRIYRITKPMSGIVTIYAQHISYDLSGIPLNPFTASSSAETMTKLQTQAAVSSPFRFFTDKNMVADFSVSVPSSTRSVLGGQEGSVLDVYRGEYEWDGFDVWLHTNRGQDNGVTIRYGKNLVEAEQDRDDSNVRTGIMPYWVAENGSIIQSEPLIISASGDYNFDYVVPVDFSSSFENQPTPEQLAERGKTYVESNKISTPKINITANFVRLEQYELYAGLVLLEKCDLCDTITIQYEELGIDAKAQIIKIKTDCLQEKYISVEIGEARSTLSDTIANQDQEIQNKPSMGQIESVVSQIAGQATATIIGAKGGNVRLLDTNEDGQPDTLYIADHPDPSQAKKVWRFNYEGWGASENGYNGPFSVAATLEQGLYADFITAGVLTANLIQAGILKTTDGKTFFLDLDSGVLRMNATEFTVAGKTIDDITKEAVAGELQDFTDAITAEIDDIKDQVDGQVQVWFGDYIPNDYNAPANQWITIADKNKHNDDLFYIVDNSEYGGHVYRWSYVNSKYQWVQIEDEDVARALADAAKAQDTADGKRRVFVSQPVPPYDIGDLWTQGSQGGLKRCKRARSEGVYSSDDWELATNYIDSEEAGNIAQGAVDGMTQDDVFNKLTNNGETQGFYIQDGKLYINAEYVKIINLITDHLLSYGENYSLESKNGQIYLYHGDYSRMRLALYYLKGDEFNYDSTFGNIQIWKGKVDKSGNLLDDNARYTYLTAESFMLGSKKDGTYLLNISNDGVIHGKNRTWIENSTGRWVFAASDGSTYNGVEALKEQSDGKRMVFRGTVGGTCYLGTTSMRWNTGFFTNTITQSDLKDKENIREISGAKAFIMALKPIAYTLKDGDTGRVHMGFGAQEVAQAAAQNSMGDLALYQAAWVEKDGQETYYSPEAPDEDLRWGLNYHEFLAPLIALVQEQEKRIQQLEKLMQRKNDLNR